MLEAKDHHSGRHGRDDYNQSSQLATCLSTNSTIDVLFKLDSLRGYLECPRTNHGDRKPNDSEQNDQSDDPVWNIEKRKDLRRDLDEQPSRHDIGDCNAVNTAPFQFAEKSARIHRRDSRKPLSHPRDYFGPEGLASFWKRASRRSGSNIGSSWRSAGVSGMPVARPPLHGIESICSKAAMARSGLPAGPQCGPGCRSTADYWLRLSRSDARRW